MAAPRFRVSLDQHILIAIQKYGCYGLTGFGAQAIEFRIERVADEIAGSNIDPDG